jgi:hypothetical protein
LSNNPIIFKRPQTSPEVSEAFDASVIAYPLGLAKTEQRVLYSAVTNEPFSLVEEKVINGIRHARLINQKTGDVLLLSEESLRLRFTSEEQNPAEVAERRMIKLSQMFKRFVK